MTNMSNIPNNATCRDCALHRSHKGGFCNGRKQPCNQIEWNYSPYMKKYEERLRLAEMMSLGKRMDEHLSMTEAEDYKKQLLTEMAYERKMFKAIITNLSQQILQNWCLIRYGRLNNADIGTITHWKTELMAHLQNASSNKIKGNNSLQARIKAISEVWVNEKEYATDSNVINLTVYGKFVNEGLDVNSDSYKQTLEECMAASGDIINAIASENAEKISQYVSSL